MTSTEKKVMILIKDKLQTLRSLAFARGKEYTLKRYLDGKTKYNKCIKEEDKLEQEILTMFQVLFKKPNEKEKRLHH